MVAQAWTDWVLTRSVHPDPIRPQASHRCMRCLPSRLASAPTILTSPSRSRLWEPNHHSAPPQPQRPPVPHTVPFLPGYYVVPQQPGQPERNPAGYSRQLSNVYQLNPLLPTLRDNCRRPEYDDDHPSARSAETSLPQPGRGTMPTYRQVPPPNGQSTTRTLHTHQPGSDRGSPSVSATVRRCTSGNPPCNHLPGSAEPGDRPASAFAKRPQ